MAELNAINGLSRHGAHFVLTRGDKKPCWTGYLDRKPGPDSITHHLGQGPDHQIGIIPHSIDCTVLDVDRGDPGTVTMAIGQPRVALDSQAHPQSHLYYDDATPRGNQVFDIAGCRGDIRSDKGFVVLYPGQHGKLYASISNDGENWYQIPWDRIQQSIFKDPDPPRPAGLEVAGNQSIILTEASLATCQQGQRHQMLFNVARKAIYPLPIPQDLDVWITQCRAMVEDLYRRIPPVPNDPVDWQHIAYQIATWTFNRLGHREHVKYDHSPQAQFRRGIKRHYGDARQWRQYMIRARNGRICDLYGIGWTQERIAADVGLSQQMIGKILAKSVMYGKAPKRQTITEAAPWDREGIKRSWWYEKRATTGQNTTA